MPNLDATKLTYTQDLNVVLPKYSLPKVQQQEILPGEEATTFADTMLLEILSEDDVQAAFKFTRYNNYKRNLYDTLAEYEHPSALNTRFVHNQIVQSLFKKEAPAHPVAGADQRMQCVVNLAVALMPLEKGSIEGIKPQVDELIKALEAPLLGTAEEALMLGSLLLPAIEACMIIYKSKLPKKPSADLKESITQPMRDSLRKFS